MKADASANDTSPASYRRTSSAYTGDGLDPVASPRTAVGLALDERDDGVRDEVGALLLGLEDHDLHGQPTSRTMLRFTGRSSFQSAGEAVVKCPRGDRGRTEGMDHGPAGQPVRSRPAELDDDEVGTPTSQGREAGDDPRIPVSAADQRDDGQVWSRSGRGCPSTTSTAAEPARTRPSCGSPHGTWPAATLAPATNRSTCAPVSGPSGPPTVMAPRAAAALEEPSPRLGVGAEPRSSRSREDAVSTRPAASTRRSSESAPERTESTIASNTAWTWSSTK